MHPELAERVGRIAETRMHGGSWLAKEAVETIVRAVELGEDPFEVGRTLVAVRPAFGGIAGAVGRVLAAARTPEQLVEEANAVLEGRERAPKAIAVLTRQDLAGRTVMTHSASATVRQSFLYGEPPGRVVCTVSEPYGEGRAFAEELRRARLAVDLVDDPDAREAARTVDLVLVGADTVFRDGTLVNKIGTCELTEAAKEAGVPVVVACEVIKLAPVEPPESLPADEARDRDLTPPEQIGRFVTEEGAHRPDDIAALVDRTPFLREGYALLAEA